MYYAVAIGRKPGIYETWDECKEQVIQFNDAAYKKFGTMEEALEFIKKKNPKANILKKTKKASSEYNYNKPKRPATQIHKEERQVKDNGVYTPFVEREKDKYYAYVDGSLNSKSNAVSYGLVVVYNDEIIFADMGTFIDDPNNVYRNVYGELKGAMKAVEIAYVNSISDITIIYDYKGIECWSNGSWKTKNDLTKYYKRFMDRYKQELSIKFSKVKAHSGDEFNEIVDTIAKNAANIVF